MHTLPFILKHPSSTRQKRIIRLRLQQGIYWIRTVVHSLHPWQVQGRGWIS